MEMKDTVRGLIVKLFDFEPEDVGDERSLTELGVDSLMALDVLTALEKEFKVRLPEESLRRFTSLNGICAVLDDEIKRAAN